MQRALARVTSAKLVVFDLEGQAKFYEQACGLVRMSRIQDEIAGRKIDEIIFKRPAAGGIIFILLKFLDQTAPCSGEMIATITTEDLKGFCERVEQGGGKVLQQPEFREEFQLWFAIAADPEGHLIEAVEFAGAAPV